MKKRGRPIKETAASAALVLVLVLTVAAVVYGLAHGGGEEAAAAEESPAEDEDDVYVLSDHDLADFSEVILEKFSQESKLVVYTVEADVSVELKQTGILDLDILNKVQTVTYQGDGRFYLDLASLGAYAITLDSRSRAVVIAIPHTRLDEIEIDPDRFSCGETERGLLAFGELKFTAKEYNELQVECKNRIRAAVDIDSNYQAADEMAVAEMEKIFDPVVQAVDASYHVEIVFADQQAAS